MCRFRFSHENVSPYEGAKVKKLTSTGAYDAEGQEPQYPEGSQDPFIPLSPDLPKQVHVVAHPPGEPAPPHSQTAGEAAIPGFQDWRPGNTPVCSSATTVKGKRGGGETAEGEAEEGKKGEEEGVIGSGGVAVEEEAAEALSSSLRVRNS